VSAFNPFTRRLRGFRVIDLAALVVLLALALGSYAFKTNAEVEDADAADTQTQIAREDKRIRLLQAEIAHLDGPDRIERLATGYLHMGPVDERREITVADLPRIARAAPPPAPTGAPALTPAADPVPGGAR